MTVEELIAELRKLPQTAEVILQADAEGNGYSPLCNVDAEYIYVAHATQSSGIYSTRWSAEDACFTESEWARFKAENPRCCVLAPVN